MQNCTNTGHIQGRKDVGGIVGQMEPFLEIQYLSDKLQELDRETDKFLDMLDATQRDFSGYSKQASAIVKNISSNLKNANSAGNALSSTATDLWYIYNQELNGISSDLKTLQDDLNRQSDEDKNNGNSHDITVSGNDIWGTVTGGDITITVPDDTESYKAALKKFGESTANHLDNMTNASTDRTGGIQDNLSLLNNSLKNAFDQLSQLGDVLEAGTDNTSAHMDEIMEQARVLRSLVSEIRDDLFRYEGISVEDTSDESASRGEINPGDSEEKDEDAEAKYDTSSFQKGKVTLCINKGIVEADTNVGRNRTLWQSAPQFRPHWYPLPQFPY